MSQQQVCDRWAIFQHIDIHKLTWKSPDGKTVNQIDHVVINNKWRKSLKDMHTCRGADAGSDHYLVMSRLKLCLRNAPTKKNRPRKYIIPRLKQNKILKTFVMEIKNKFRLLSTEETGTRLRMYTVTLQRTLLDI